MQARGHVPVLKNDHNGKLCSMLPSLLSVRQVTKSDILIIMSLRSCGQIKVVVEAPGGLVGCVLCLYIQLHAMPTPTYTQAYYSGVVER